MKRPYWWHGYPWLLCNLAALLSAWLTFNDIRDGRWGWAAGGAVAIIVFSSYADSHRKQYDAIRTREYLGVAFRNLFGGGQK